MPSFLSQMRPYASCANYRASWQHTSNRAAGKMPAPCEVSWMTSRHSGQHLMANPPHIVFVWTGEVFGLGTHLKIIYRFFSFNFHDVYYTLKNHCTCLPFKRIFLPGSHHIFPTILNFPVFWGPLAFLALMTKLAIFRPFWITPACLLQAKICQVVRFHTEVGYMLRPAWYQNLMWTTHHSNLFDYKSPLQAKFLKVLHMRLGLRPIRWNNWIKTARRRQKK